MATFNDLVSKYIIFETPEKAKEILERMFPNSEVRVFVDRGGKTVVEVDDVEMRMEPTE